MRTDALFLCTVVDVLHFRLLFFGACVEGKKRGETAWHMNGLRKAQGKTSWHREELG